MNPLLLFLLLFVGIPLFELYWLIEVGSSIGPILTVFLVVFTAVLGGVLVRMQGFSTALRVRGAMEQGEVPAVEMLEGVVLLVCGVLLLLPGFFTDLLGFLGLIPVLRQRLILAFLKRAQVLHPHYGAGGGEHPRQRVINGEFHREDNDSG